MPADETKPAAPVPASPAAVKAAASTAAAGVVLGTINGVEVKANDKGKADVPAAVDPATLTDAEWHARFIARETVTLVKPKRSVLGRIFPELKKDVALQSARCVVAHRTLDDLSPGEKKALRAAFEATSPKDESDAAFTHWAVRRIEAELPAAVAGVALKKTLAVHATADKLREHRARAVAKVAKSAPAS